jgi:hypothetical protein
MLYIAAAEKHLIKLDNARAKKQPAIPMHVCRLGNAPLFSSWPGSSRPSTSFFLERLKDVDARHKARHDGVKR